MAVPIVAINVLVSREGLTVFARLGDLGPFGQGDLTVEALVYGAVVALKVTLLILITTLASLAVDPDELLRGLRRLSFRSALTASLSIRMIPLLAADSRRIAEAQRTRPGGALPAPAGGSRVLGAVVGGSLDRAMDVAATLELRGFAAARHAPRRSFASSPARPASARPRAGGGARRPPPARSARRGHGRAMTSRSRAPPRRSSRSPCSAGCPERRHFRPTRSCTCPSRPGRSCSAPR